MSSQSKIEKSTIEPSEDEWKLDYSKSGLVIGLEIHTQLNALKTKLFCGCDSNYREDGPNTHVCSICLGLPGTLPVMNKRAVEFATKLAISLHSDIHEKQFFFRKNYYYPDMSRNFQITQYNRGGGVPFASGGFILIKMKDGTNKKVKIDRMHLEDDPGKLNHIGSLQTSPYTLVDYNRCGTTLVEMVTAPEMYSPEEARAFVNKYKTILTYTGICDPTQDGAFRVDANVSLEGHNRVEIKNIGSIKEVEKALRWEIFRMKQMVKRNQEIKRETRAWNGKQTTLLRTKEEEDDYRYFPEPELVPFDVSKEMRKKAEVEMPELPDQRMNRYQKQFDMSEYDADVLINNKESADFYEKCAELTKSFKILLNWLNNDVQGFLNDNNLELSQTKLTPKNFVALLDLLENETISTKIAKKILPDVIQGKIPEDIVKKQNLEQVDDEETLDTICDKIITENQNIVEAAKSKPKVFNALIGKIMKETKGKADIELAKKILAEKTDFDLSQL